MASQEFSSESAAARACLARYWRANLVVLAVLLALWALASFGLGIWWARDLSGLRLGGYPLGFWFAQQGSILVFVALIGIYCVVMNALDRWHHGELEQLRREAAAGNPVKKDAP